MENLEDFIATKSIKKNNFQENLFIEVKNLIPFNTDTFEGTIAFSKNNEKNIQLIETVDNKRIFYKFKENKKVVSYIEQIQSNNISYLGLLNKNISFLFCPNDINEKNIDNNKCFGFRFYLDNPIENDVYFTLLKLNENDDYIILEKDVVSIKNNNFYNKKLNCLEIIKEIIFNKYKNSSINSENYPFSLGDPVIEVMAFSYVVSYTKNNLFNFLPLHIINIFDTFSFIKEKTIEYNKFYFIPIAFNDHVSLLLFEKNINNKISYIIFDYSLFFCNEINLKPIVDDIIFSPEIKNNLMVLPKNKIQLYNSCSMWYYGQVLYLLENEENINKKSFLKSLDNKTYFVNVCNKIAKLENFNENIIEIYDDEKSIVLNENFFYVKREGKIFKINKFAFLNNFVDISNFVNLFLKFKFIQILFLEILQKIQTQLELINDEIMRFKYNYECRKFKNYLLKTKNKDEMNNNYNDLESFQDIIKILESLNNDYKNVSMNYINFFIQESTEEYSFLLEENYIEKKSKKINLSKQYLDMRLDSLGNDFNQITNNFRSSHKIIEINEINNKIKVLGLLYK